MGSSDVPPLEMFDLFQDAPAVVEDPMSRCPRCARELAPDAERFYGPCTECRAALRAAFLGEGREVEVAEYVPKMNVTPNAVALKDD
jgi:hypothetical protein